MYSMDRQFGFVNDYVYKHRGKTLKWFPSDTRDKFLANDKEAKRLYLGEKFRLD